MLALWVLRSALSTFSLVFGSLGIFFLISSLNEPYLASYAVMFLGTATAIEFGCKE